VGFVGTPTTAQVVPLFASLQGANEVPGPGSPDGGGTALLILDPSGNQVCYSLAVAGVAGTVSMAHIHQGAASMTGPVVVQFLPPTQGSVSGCLTIAHDLLVNLVRTPGASTSMSTRRRSPQGCGTRSTLQRGLRLDDVVAQAVEAQPLAAQWFLTATTWRDSEAERGRR
jgi:CHRD domain